MAVVRFDEALARMVAWAYERVRSTQSDVWLLRDLTGHLRVLTDEAAPLADDERQAMHARLGAFSPGPRGLALARSVVGTDEELTRDRVRVGDRLWLIDRLVTEQGWNRGRIPGGDVVPRITFFGVKGGVGRSTSLVALALHLAKSGKRVMVLDLDLESPGITSMLLRAEDLPPYGVTDWMVEDAVGQADEALLDDMTVTSPTSERLKGDIVVVPAVGARSVPDDEPADDEARLRDGSFVSKLGRAYMPGAADADFAERLGRMIAALEQRHRPDVVLIDSRAGLHDISAATIPRLGGTVLLFAGATSQTWLAYRLMFSTWRRDAAVLDRFRARLRVVAAQVPETGRAAYVERIRDEAHAIFTSFVYEPDPVAGPDAEEAFNFAIDDPDAPHHPLPVYWRRELVEWEPCRAASHTSENEPLPAEQFDAAFGPFLRGVMALPYVADLTRSPKTAEEDAP